MIKRTVSEIAAMLGLPSAPGWERIQVRGVSTDSRTLQPGNLYIPIPGVRYNGHHFAAQAAERKASALLWNRNEPNPPEHLPVLIVDDTVAAMQKLAAAYRRQLGVRVCGITGSNGKTSTKDMLASVLSMKYKTHKTEGNLNNHIGVPLTLLAMEEDTEFAVIEMGMSSLGEIRLLSSLAKPDFAIITNTSEVHLGDLLTRERIVQAKLEIAESLTASGLLLYNGDVVRLKRAIEERKLPCPAFSFGLGAANDIAADEVRVTSDGVVFRTNEASFAVPVLGKHQAVNALAAVACARLAGLSDEWIREGLAQVRLTGMRNEWIQAGGLAIINDTYKSNPSSVRAALDLLYTLGPYKRKIAVLGEMAELGEESEQLHREIGLEIDPAQIEYLFTIGPMARHIAAAAKTRLAEENIFHCEDREQLTERLKTVIADNTLLLVKGSRKLELEQAVDSLKRWAAGER